MVFLLTLTPWTAPAMIGGVALLTLLPGVQVSRWLGLWRGRGSPTSLVLSAALGLVVSPLLLFSTGWLFGLSRVGVWLVLILFTLLTAWLNTAYPHQRYRRKNGIAQAPAARSERLTAPNATGIGAQQNEERLAESGIPWLLVGVVGLLSISLVLVYTEGRTELGSYPIQIGDWVKHHGVAWSLRHTGIPPKNVFFSGMAPEAELVYYYFLHLTIAALDLVQGGAANLQVAFVVMALVASASFATVFYLLARHLLRDQRAAGAALLFATVIGGLDIIPSVRRALMQQPDRSLLSLLLWPVEHIDNWTPTQQLRLSTFTAHHLWVPQHLTALLIVVLGLYLYAVVTPRRRVLPVLAVLIATVLGHSTWIALIVYMALPLFALYQIGQRWRSEGRTEALRLLGGYGLVAAGAVVLGLPFGWTLLNQGAAQAGIAFEIPHDLGAWPLLTPFSARFPESAAARLLDVPGHYFIEMGALLVCGLGGVWLFWRERRREPLLPFLTLLLGLGLGTITFFASGRGYEAFGLTLNNDLGLRASMPAQLALALFAGWYLARITRRSRWQLILIVPLIALGLASSVWEVMAMGVTKYSRPPQVPANVLRAFEALPELTPPGAVVQHRTHDDFSRVQPGYTQRFNGYSTSEAIVFYDDPLELALALELAEQAFANRLPLRSYQLFSALGADYVFVGPAEQEQEYHPEKFRHPLYFKPVYDRDDVSIVEIRAPFTDEPQASFDEGAIEFRGYFVDPSPIYPGDGTALPVSGESNGPPGLVTAWRLTRPVDKDYTVFMHLVDPDNNIVAQADHQVWAWDVTGEGPTTTWTPNLTHLDIVPLPAAALKAGTPLSIRLGLWLPEEGRHFSVESRSLEIDQGGRLVVGNLDLMKWTE